MTFIELEALLIDLTGEPAARVRTRVRGMRKAGMVTKGGRGPHAPHLTARDLATLLLGIAPHGDETAAPETAAAFGAAGLIGVTMTPNDDDADAWSIHSAGARGWRPDLLPPAMRHLGMHDALSGLEAVLSQVADDADLAVDLVELIATPTGPRVFLHLDGPDRAWRLRYATSVLTGRKIVMRAELTGQTIIGPAASAVMGAWR